MDNRANGAYSGRVIRRLTLLLVLTVVAAAPLCASSVTILLDASFSMSLPAGTSTRFEVAADGLRAWIASRPPDTRYALLVAEHGAAPVRELPYPATGEQVSVALDEIVPWGSIDLGGSIREAARLAASIAGASGDRTTRLLVVSDGEDLSALTGSSWPLMPANVRVETLLLPRRSPTGVHDLLASFDARQPVPADETIDPLATERDEPTPSAPQDPASAVDPPKEAGAHEGAPADEGAARGPAGSPPHRPESLLLRWARIARWLFLAGALLGLVAVWKAAARHNRRVRAVAAHNEQPPSILLDIRGPSGREEVRITSYPAAMGDGSGGSLHADLAAASPRVTLDVDDEAIVLSAADKVAVNGVGRREHTVREGNQIRVGSVRVVVREIARPKPLRPPRPRHRLYPLAPAASAAVALVAFLLSALATPAAEPSTQPGGREAPVTVARENDAGPAADAQRRAPPDGEERDGAETARTADEWDPGSPAARATPRLALPRVVGPAEPLPDIDLDYLAVHAHPDDESLDFGSLLARMSAAGLRGAVLLLTDGNAGLDQYPWRATGARYPAYDLAGEELASVRVDEAREAIGWLGADLYVRFALPNHPYNSIEQELDPREILDRWGGVDELASRLRSVVTALDPEIILAPDGPAGPDGPLEHFEHEATGLLVDRLLDTLGAGTPVGAVASDDARASIDRAGSVRLALRSVDPMQTDAYRTLYALEPFRPADDGTVPRVRQMLALRAHRTQRDATVIGVETRMTLRYEYYRLDARSPDAYEIAGRLGLERVDLATSRPYPMPERRTP